MFSPVMSSPMRMNLNPGPLKTAKFLRANPYQFLEGVAICSYAAQANAAYVYCRGEFWDLAHELEEKIAELYKAGYLGEKLFGSSYQLDIYVHLGAGAYICGEETALLEVLRGETRSTTIAATFPCSRGAVRQTDGRE